VLASIHAVEPVSIFTRVSFASLYPRVTRTDVAICTVVFRFCEIMGRYVSNMFHSVGPVTCAGGLRELGPAAEAEHAPASHRAARQAAPISTGERWMPHGNDVIEQERQTPV
jgi:hypothetical protein